jgi:hypothetical protein
MNHVDEMIRTSPHAPLFDRQALATCIDACIDCAQTCMACTAACMGETDQLPELVPCIRLNQDCAEICMVTANILSRSVSPNPDIVTHQLAMCVLVCDYCIRECLRHATQHDHCRVCAEACRRCIVACRNASGELGGLRMAAATH